MNDDHLETLFLDAGGVLVHPNWERVSQALAQAGVKVPVWPQLASVAFTTAPFFSMPKGSRSGPPS